MSDEFLEQLAEGSKPNRWVETATLHEILNRQGFNVTTPPQPVGKTVFQLVFWSEGETDEFGRRMIEIRNTRSGKSAMAQILNLEVFVEDLERQAK